PRHGERVVARPGAHAPTARPAVAAVIEVRDGRMVGETLHYDLDTLCRQAGYSVDAVRAAAEPSAWNHTSQRADQGQSTPSSFAAGAGPKRSHRVSEPSQEVAPA